MVLAKRRAAAAKPTKNLSPNNRSGRLSQTPGACCKFFPTTWTAWNLVGLVLNLLVLCATLGLYQRGFATSPIAINRHEEDKQSQQQRQPVQTLRSARLQAKNNLAREKFSALKQLQQQRRQQSGDDNSAFHIVFSTGCNPKQDLQSYVLFHSILESGQLGHATRIASGCTSSQATALHRTFATQIKSMAPDRFHLHLTPEFGTVDNPDGEATSFHYLNKPFGVAHWMEEVLGYTATNPQTSHDETIIMLLDPDMILMRPFVNDFTQGDEVWRDRTTYPHMTKVRHGYPMSQEYGYNIAWFDGVKNVRDVIPADEMPSPVQNMTRKQLTENYTAGPPYLATARDFYRLAAKWRQLALPVCKLFPGYILGEMYAYSWAAAHLNMPHQLAHSFMVSNYFEQGFQLFNRMNFSTKEMCRGIPHESKPHVLHYCQPYRLGKYILGKYRLPESFVGQEDSSKVCEHPLLAAPPDNFATLYDYYIDPDSHLRYNLTASKWGVYTRQENIDRTAFMICEETDALNRAAMYYKQEHCDSATMNTAKTLIFHDSLEVTPQEKQNYALV